MTTTQEYLPAPKPRLVFVNLADSGQVGPMPFADLELSLREKRNTDPAVRAVLQIGQFLLGSVRRVLEDPTIPTEELRHYLGKIAATEDFMTAIIALTDGKIEALPSDFLAHFGYKQPAKTN